MSTTPETDKLVAQTPDFCGLNELSNAYNNMLAHARHLERQNAALREALRLAREWIENDEGRDFADIVAIADRAKARGDKAWNEKFEAMCRAVNAALARQGERG